MVPKLSPYGLDLGRVWSLLARPNYRLSAARASNDAAFPESGLMQLSGVIDPTICRQVITDYDRFESVRDGAQCTVRDSKGRNLRLANFHLESRALLDVGLHSAFHQPVSRFFGHPSTVYTSLTYKHGSQQSAHIDTPFFWTRPFNLFVGVWVALEDIRADAGPLFYYPGSHRLWSRERDLIDLYEASGKDIPKMFDAMRDLAETRTQKVELLLKAGDAVVWHPGILHGGSLATDPTKTRYSTVFHFAALGTNVRDQRAFPGEFANLPTYGVKQRGGHHYCRGRLPTAML
jgi:hypothetical protein